MVKNCLSEYFFLIFCLSEQGHWKRSHCLSVDQWLVISLFFFLNNLIIGYLLSLELTMTTELFVSECCCKNLIYRSIWIIEIWNCQPNYMCVNNIDSPCECWNCLSSAVLPNLCLLSSTS